LTGDEMTLPSRVNPTKSAHAAVAALHGVTGVLVALVDAPPVLCALV
jgi:hypothetical protein